MLARYNAGMNQRQHYAPQVYLRQWCDDAGCLLRYCRVGPPGAPRLRVDPKVPKEICWEHDLYSLPVGGAANGMTGDELDRLLKTDVEDNQITAIVAAIGGHTGILQPALGERVQWLMQTFVARSRSGLAAAQSDMDAWAAQHESMIQRTLARPTTPEIEAELRMYIDPRMPFVAARAKLGAVIATEQRPTPGWYEGSVQVRVIQAASIEPLLATVGLDHFPTFDEPVVEWETNSRGVVAGFALSPDALALVVEQASADDDWRLAATHVMSALPHRQFAICRNKAAGGTWLKEAEQLRPWTPEK